MTSRTPNSGGAEQFSSISRRSLLLNPDDLELWEMFYYAGLTLDPKVFQAIIDLIKMDIHPKAVADVLESVAPDSKYYVSKPRTGQKPDPSQASKKSRSSHTSLSSASSRKSKSSSEVGKTEASRLSKKTSRPSKTEIKQEQKAPGKKT